MEPILKTENICKSFAGVRVLNDINFVLFPGEVHVLLGENGAGKSTFIKILSGVYPYDSGRIFLDGKEIIPKNPSHMLKLGISTIHQELVLAPHLTVEENICLGDIPSNMGIVNWREVRYKTLKSLQTLGIEIDPNKKISQLSVAQKQLVAIARAISFDAKIIIMDEPTAALSEDEVNNLFNIIRKLKEKGVAFIYISHRLPEVFEIGDRVTIFRDGNLIINKEIADVDTDSLVQWMVGRRVDELYFKEEHLLGEPMLRINNVYNDKLKGISLELHSGEVLGITGLIGAGKSELAMSLFGSYPIYKGEVILEGIKKEIKSPIDAINNGICLIPEDRRTQALFLQLSVVRNITSALPNGIVNKGILSIKKEHKIAKKYIKELSIKVSTENQRVMYLSGGNQQKVVLARWLSKDSKIYIFDEPTRGLDVGAKSEIYRHISILCKNGCGVIVFSSDIPEIINISDRILVMYEGQIVAELDPEKTTQEEILMYATGQKNKRNFSI